MDSEISKPGLGGYTVAVTKENLSIKALDLNSMKSIKCFADEILKEEKHIELLILNAGIMVSA